MHPANRLPNLRRRVSRARKFPTNTCPASRHLHTVARQLLAPERLCPHTLEEMWGREHLAATMLSVLESLWKARTEIARLNRASKA